MCIAATRVEQDHALSVPVDLHVSGPDIAVDEDRLNAPAPCLEWPQQSRDDLIEEFSPYFVHFGIRSSDTLFPFDVRPKLAAEEFLPSIAPFVDEGYNAIECGDVEPKIPGWGHRMLVQFLKDLNQLCWLGNLVTKISEWCQEK